MDRWVGRVAVVTGASSGIGACIAADLVRKGLVVVGVARRQERLAELAASLKGASGKFHALQADLSQGAEVRRAFKWIEDNLGGVSVMVNNAAVLLMQATQDMDAASTESIVSTNLTCTMLCASEAINSMRRHGIKDGHIININSVAGHRIINPPDGIMSVTAYATTKHAMTAFSTGLRYDVQKIPGFKIRVTSLSPGAVATDMLPKQYRERVPDPEMLLRPENISSAVQYVLSSPPAVEITELTIQPVGEGF